MSKQQRKQSLSILAETLAVEGCNQGEVFPCQRLDLGGRVPDTPIQAEPARLILVEESQRPVEGDARRIAVEAESGRP